MNYDEQMRQMAGLSFAQQGAVTLGGVQRASVITQQMSLMNEQLGVAGKLVNELGQRLSKVMRSENSAAPEKSLGEAPNTGVPLGDELAAQYDQLDRIIGTLRAINERLEL